MFLKEFNLTGQGKINKINAVLQEEYGVSIKSGFPKKQKLEEIKEKSEMAIIKLKTTSKKFQLEPEYAKFLGIKDVVTTMLSEGQYCESPAYNEMKQFLTAEVRRLMDSGCTNEEACSQCMNTYRQDPRWCYDDKHILPIIIKASKDYMDEGLAGTLGGAAIGGLAGALIPGADGAASGLGQMSADKLGSMGVTLPADMDLQKLGGAVGATAGAVAGGALDDSVQHNQTPLSELALRGLAEEVGVNIEDVESYDAVANKINVFAGVSGRTTESIVRFLNELDEETLPKGIKYFGAQVAEANRFIKARKDAIKAGKEEFEVYGKVYKVTGDKSQELDEAVSELSNLVEFNFFKKTADQKVGDAISSVGDTVKDVGKGSVEKLSKLGLDKDGEIMKALGKNPGLTGAGTVGLGALAAYGGYKGLKKMFSKKDKKESMFDDIINDMLAEEIESVEEAEVLMAVRALADDIQDHVERLGRMINEDIPAIGDQMVNEFGAQKAQDFKNAVEEILTQALESNKMAKEGLSGLVNGMTGQAVNVDNIDSMGVEEPISDPLADLDDVAVSDNEPALSGPEEEPLGRAPVDV
jgi:uncharacterized protein YaaR (DUF327 family)